MEGEENMGRMSDWLSRCSALREMRRLASMPSAADFSPEHPLKLAKDALDTGNRIEAAMRWAQVKNSAPAMVYQHPSSFDILVGIGSPDEAEEFARSAVALDRRDLRAAMNYARSAELRSDLHEAARRWAIVRKRFPRRPEGYANEVRSLIRIGEYRAAEALSKRAARKFERDDACQVLHCESAASRGDWPEALRRWLILEQRRDNRPVIQRGIAKSLCKMGRADEALRVLEAAQVKYPFDHNMATFYAQICEEIGDLERALQQYATIIHRFPCNEEGYRQRVRLLERAGHKEEALSLMTVASARFPNADWLQQLDVGHQRRNESA